VTLLAGLWEPAGHVVRVRRLLESCQVAGRTLRWSAGKLSARMALRTLYCYVGSRERKYRLGVIECRTQP
jgi:hypothetical protein